MREEFKIYGGDLKVTIDVTVEKKQMVFDRIIKFIKENDCTSGECLHQSDSCIIDSPTVLSDIIDDILDIETEWLD